MKVGQHKVQSDMDLLGWKEITTSIQKKNGTRIFQLPIKKHGQLIEVGSFKSGYVRRMNGCYTPYQLNKCVPNTEYHPERRWCEIQKTALKTGKYFKYMGKRRVKIPNETDRIQHLITYCLKNYYINGANQVEDGKLVTKWYHEYQIEKLTKEMDDICEEHNSKDQRYTWSGGQITDSKTGDIYIHDQHAYWNKIPNSVSVIVDGHRYPVIANGEKY
tara:strand:- start:15 stop:665 length:651 start_codon:yes stop_codon:yes gene_type:complete